MADDEMSKQEEEAAMDAAREWNAKKDHLHDIFSPYYNKSCQRDVALEKWGPMIEELVQRDLERMGRREKKTNFLPEPSLSKMPEKDAPDLDRE